jgi:hypothetical protein
MNTLCKFYLRLLHPKAITEKAAEHFFVFKCQFPADPPKGSGTHFWCLLHGIFLSKNIFPLRRF